MRAPHFFSRFGTSAPISRRQWLTLATAGSAGMCLTNRTPLFGEPFLYGQEGPTSPPEGTYASGNNVAASVHPLATEAAIAMYQKGGNAIDAAIAAALTLSVVDGHNSGIGGGCLAIVRTATGQILALDGREMAPQLAHRDMYIRDGKADGKLSQDGPLAVATPGQLAALYELSVKHGYLRWHELFEPAIAHAENGFPIDRVLASRIAAEADIIRRYPETARILLKADSTPYAQGDTLQQSDLAKTMQAISTDGPDWFYRGPFAQTVGVWMKENRGLLSATDFANYHCQFREPIRSPYRGFEIVGMPPPSSGGVHVAQMLNILQEFPLPEIWNNDPSLAYHLLLEAMQLAFADRAYWLGDSDFVKVPRGLIDPAYGRILASKISRSQKTRVAQHHQPSNATTDLFNDRKHTTHLTTADQHGNWVAITSTVNTTFGSKVIVPGTGVVLNNEMDDFSIAPNTPNAFGLVGSEANSIAPGKRPLSSMSPTLVLDAQGQPVLSCGAAGGPKIITAVLRIITGVLDQALPVTAAVAAPRVHHQWQPDEAVVEERLPASCLNDLKNRGHTTRSIAASAIAQAIQKTADGALHAASDPRVPSRALACDLPADVSSKK
jgi:gamma-glutamyltranspeptidase / glutathione hydrolase